MAETTELIAPPAPQVGLQLSRRLDSTCAKCCKRVNLASISYLKDGDIMLMRWLGSSLCTGSREEAEKGKEEGFLEEERAHCPRVGETKEGPGSGQQHQWVLGREAGYMGSFENQEDK